MTRKKRPYILISNDDGVHAPGIAILAEELATIADVAVIAPDRNKSGVSNALTLHKPLRHLKLENGFISVEGTPTDCVYLGGSAGILKRKPTMVVSGVNSGPNLGDDVIYSGTLSAAIAGRMLGLPSIAVSLAYEGNLHYPEDENKQHFRTAAIVIKNIITQMGADDLPERSLLNVNVPNLPIDELKGHRITRLGTRYFSKPVIAETDPRGKLIYWIGPPGDEQDAGSGTDFYAVSNGHVSITPLTLDFTNHSLIKELAASMKGLTFKVTS